MDDKPIQCGPPWPVPGTPGRCGSQYPREPGDERIESLVGIPPKVARGVARTIMDRQDTLRGRDGLNEADRVELAHLDRWMEWFCRLDGSAG